MSISPIFKFRGLRGLQLPLLFCAVGCSCSVAEPKASANVNAVPSSANSSVALNSAPAVPKGATIEIEPNGPADTVRAFYRLLKEKKFREAIFLTNLRPAVEGLTDTELKDFALDFEALAGTIPAEVEINGEITTGDIATVTANLPNEDGDKNEIQTIKLRRENGVWIITTADDEAAKRIKAEGKQYFYNLRIETHQEEARKMLERISKAQLAYSLQNGGVVTDFDTLISSGFLPDDVKTSESTGYSYVVNLTPDKRRYTATATPATYGKSGKMSYFLQLDGKGVSHVTSKDTGGVPMTK